MIGDLNQMTIITKRTKGKRSSSLSQEKRERVPKRMVAKRAPTIDSCTLISACPSKYWYRAKSRSGRTRLATVSTMWSPRYRGAPIFQTILTNYLSLSLKHSVGRAWETNLRTTSQPSVWESKMSQKLTKAKRLRDWPSRHLCLEHCMSIGSKQMKLSSLHSLTLSSHMSKPLT